MDKMTRRSAFVFAVCPVNKKLGRSTSLIHWALITVVGFVARIKFCAFQITSGIVHFRTKVRARATQTRSWAALARKGSRPPRVNWRSSGG